MGSLIPCKVARTSSHSIYSLELFFYYEALMGAHNSKWDISLQRAPHPPIDVTLCYLDPLFTRLLVSLLERFLSGKSFRTSPLPSGVGDRNESFIPDITSSVWRSSVKGRRDISWLHGVPRVSRSQWIISFMSLGSNETLSSLIM